MKVGERRMAGEPGGQSRAKGPFNISIAPGIVTTLNLSQAPTARFIAFDKYLSGAALSSSKDLLRAFGPHFLFFDSLLGRWPRLI